ncbi:MAG TPA: hypothetical protein VHR41_02375 [Gemmatimonadales bacterium]|jgi:hypothetical protein|nr:hypothetical protein [Gemmatimonadales bacterium]
MVWRVVEHDDRRWNVSILAERRGNSPQWTLVFSFRPVDQAQGPLWAASPLTSTSKATLFAQAEKLSEDMLAAILAEHLQ